MMYFARLRGGFRGPVGPEEAGDPVRDPAGRFRKHEKGWHSGWRDFLKPPMV